jgi:ActR/RegA family two-component response regulator
MISVLLVDDDDGHAERLERELALRGLRVIRAADAGEAIKELRENASICDLVILCIADRVRPWRTFLHALQEARWQARFLEVPLFLCTSRLGFGVEFQLQIERTGARYACEE